jgi:hypothetical protein
MTTVDVPGLGPVVWDDEYAWYVSEPVTIAALDGVTARVFLEGYDDDPAPDAVHAAVRTFLTMDASALHAAAPMVFGYYRETAELVGFDDPDEPMPVIAGPEAVWDHVRIGDEVTVARSARDGGVYVSIECECAWEVEHGLQIVFRDGAEVTKVGPYDGSMT